MNFADEKRSKEIADVSLGNLDEGLENLKGNNIFSSLNFYSNVSNIEPLKRAFFEGAHEKIEDDQGLNSELELFANNLGLEKKDVLDVLEAQREKLLAISKAEVLSSEDRIKIGNANISKKTLLRIPVYMGLTIAGSAFFGVGGLAASLTFRVLDKYRKDKKQEAAINKKLDEKYNLLSGDQDSINHFNSDLIDSLLIKKMEKNEKSFYENFSKLSDSEKFSFLLQGIDNGPNFNLDSETKEYMVAVQMKKLSIEMKQREREDSVLRKNPGFFDRLSKKLPFIFAKDSIDSKVTKTAIVSGAVMGLGLAAREIPILKNVLGAYLGYNVASLAFDATVKKEKAFNINEVDQNKLKQDLEFISQKYNDFKAKEDLIDENSSVDQITEKEEAREQLQALLGDIRDLSYSILIKLDDPNFKKEDPSNFLALKRKMLEFQKYERLINFRFNIDALNNEKEKKIKEAQSKEKILSFSKKFCKVSGALIGALVPELIDIYQDKNSIDRPDEIIDNVSAKNSSENIIIEQNNSPEVSSIESSVTENTVSNTSEIGSFEKGDSFRELIGAEQKSIILEKGDGISKIFDGYMGSEHKVTFVNTSTGETIEAAASSKIVYPGDKVILSEDGDVFVLSDRNFSDASSALKSSESVSTEDINITEVETNSTEAEANKIENVVENNNLDSSVSENSINKPEPLTSIDSNNDIPTQTDPNDFDNDSLSKFIEDIKSDPRYSFAGTEKIVAPTESPSIDQSVSVNSDINDFNNDALADFKNYIKNDPNMSMVEETRSIPVENSSGEGSVVNNDKDLETDQSSNNQVENSNNSSDLTKSSEFISSDQELHLDNLAKNPDNLKSFSNLMGDNFIKDNQLQVSSAYGNFGEKFLNVNSENGASIQVEFKIDSNGFFGAEIRDGSDNIFSNKYIEFKDAGDISIFKEKLLESLKSSKYNSSVE